MNNIYAVGKLVDAYSFKCRGKTSYIISASFDFFNHYTLWAISLEVTQICSHALLFHVVLVRLTSETPATEVQLSRASSNHIPLLKTL